MIALSRHTVDDPRHPKKAMRLRFMLQGAPDLFSNPAFVQADVYGAMIYPLGKDGRLVLRTELGVTAINNICTLPLSLQFRAGGPHSIRGYSYNSIGIGKNIFTGSIAYRHRIKKHFYATAFFDAGDVRNGNVFHSLKKGVGVGIVWQSLVGALSLTVAQAQDLPGKPWSVQFSMGPDI